MKRITLTGGIAFSLIHFVQGVDVTVSTPSLTAVRFTTGRIEVLINNVQSGRYNT